MRLGLLQCGHIPDPLAARHGDYPRLYAHLLRGHGFEWTAWAVCDGDFPEGPHAADGWLVSGSRHGAYEPHEWIPPLEALLRDIHSAGRPLVGICFGHQIVAQALGGRVEKFPGGWATGHRAYQFEGETWHLNAWHQDQVTAPPPGAHTIAANEFAAYAGFAIGPRTLTIQPHPEFGPAFIADMIETVGRGRVPDDQLDRTARDTALPVDNDRMGRRLAGFFLDAP